MNKTRFYEITQAAAKGEDLSVFVPTNAAEAELIANLGGGGATIELPTGGTPITTNNVPLSTLYFKTDMSIEEVNNIIDNAVEVCTQKFDDFGCIVFGDETGLMFLLASIYNPEEGTSMRCIMVGRGSSSVVLYQSPDVYGEGFIGWNPRYFTDKNYVTFSELAAQHGWSDVNDITEFAVLDDVAANVIKPLVSANKDFSAGGLKGAPIEAGVPCTKIYPNLNASTQELIDAYNEFATLCQTTPGGGYPHVTLEFEDKVAEKYYGLSMIVQDNIFIFTLTNNDDYIPVAYYYIGPLTDEMLQQMPEGLNVVSGWQTQNLTEEGCFEIPSNLEWCYTDDKPAEVYEALTKIFSAGKPYSDGKKKVSGTYDGSEITVTVTGDQTINIESLLDQNKLPLKIKVKVSE